MKIYSEELLLSELIFILRYTTKMRSHSTFVFFLLNSHYLYIFYTCSYSQETALEKVHEHTHTHNELLGFPTKQLSKGPFGIVPFYGLFLSG